ncbi:hypothetical protein CAP35_01205 [Chitinophagaceae bacterium IBVUCB1]|nr:hypothetical protein CAP35_01205 [Chitinophagaceae bacterium IBVUCB1]
MSSTRVIHHPVQLIVRQPLTPVNIYTVLPGHIRRVVGVKVVHSVGVHLMSTDMYLPAIGYLSLEFNNRNYHMGHIDVPFDNRAEASDAYLDTQIDIIPDSLLSGHYENNVFTGTDYQRADGTITDKWSNYIVTIYLKALSDD